MNKITDERLNDNQIESIMSELTRWDGELSNRDLRNVKKGFDELLTLRKEKQALIEDAERLAYLVRTYVSHDLIGQVISIEKHTALMAQMKGE